MATKAKPTDFTGRVREELLEKHAEELAARADEISTATAAAAKKAANEIVDVTKGAPEVIEAVEETVALSENHVIMRVNTDIEDMTFGAGNFYTFKVGQKYKVPKDLHDYLDTLGYVWH